MGRIGRGLQLGIKSLLLHKLRSGLTVLGIVFGVAAVISMLAVGEGASRDAQTRIEQLGATNIIIRSVKPSDESTGGRQAFILNYGLKYDDYDRILATVPTIRRAVPVREIRKQIRHLDKFLDGRVVGTTHEYAEFNRLELDKGRFLTEADNDQVQNYAVLASETARILFPFREVVGSTIKLGSDYYKVVGVTRERSATASIGGSLAGQDYNKDVYIPLSTCKLRFGERIVNVRREVLRPRRLSSRRSRFRSARSPRSGRRIRSSRVHRNPGTTRRRTSTSSCLTSFCSKRSTRPASSVSSWARSPRSRSWSEGSAS